jgi:RHS repeat-associated protein
MTPDDFVYSRTRQDWTIRRLYRPDEPLPYLADQDADGVLESYSAAVLAPPGRFAAASPAVHVLPGSGHTVSYAFVSRVETEIIEANGLLSSALGYPVRNPIVTLSKSDSDDFGNQILSQNYGVTSDSSYDDERFTATTYALGGDALSRWIIGKPASIRVTDELGRFVAQTNFYYDGKPFEGLPAGSVGSRALLHRTEQLVTGNTPLLPLAAQSDLPGDPRLPAGAAINTSRSQFDDLGNAIVQLDPLASASKPSAGHARQIAYDSRFRTYPVEERICVGNNQPDLVMRAGYDPSFGVVTSSTDFNGNVTSYEYDGFARLVAIIKPYDSSAQPTALFQYLPADPTRARIYGYDRAGNLKLDSSGQVRASSRVVTRLREQAGQPGTFVTVSYSDGCGRKLAEATEGDNTGQWIVKKAQSYNRRLAVQSDWLPYDVSLGEDDTAPPQFGLLWPGGRPPSADLAGKPIVKTDHRRDPLGREILTLNPAETWAKVAEEASRTRSQTQILPLEKRLFDENDSDPASPYAGTPMVHFEDGLGRLIKVQEVVRLTDEGEAAKTPVAWTTSYRYDLNNQLVHILDSQNNQKWFRYDGLGRKLFMNDPDRGVMTYTYDDASNLAETTDAKAQRIAYSYDGVNRLLTEKYDDGLPLPPWRPSAAEPQLSTSNSVVYHYDAPAGLISLGDGTTAMAENTKGILAWVEDLSGEEHTSYDTRARVTWTVKRIPDPQFLSAPATAGRGVGALVSYKTAFAYDSLDRVTTLTYPDNDSLGYEYSPRNLLQRIPGGPNGAVISNVVYRPSDQLSRIDYGNGVRTGYEYDPRLRLCALTTIAPSAGQGAATELINFHYEFDGVSNIKSITDARPASQVPLTDPRRNTQRFAYDDLYRLTRAEYNTLGTGTNSGHLDYRYDRIGNMLAQTSDIVHEEKGLPVANLGQMASGGASGRWERVGRAASDPPGPHALTSIRNTQSAARDYPYDPNGNMTVIDGLTNTWDFKDRLISVENAEMRAEYAYDYTDRRIAKRVWTKAGTAPTNSPFADGETTARPSLTTLYIDKFFEVREHDAPTKYVWNGNTRVARVTGSLSTNLRVQRLRVWPGWNLCSLAVSGLLPVSAGDGQGEVVRAAFRWHQASQGWVPVSTNDALPAGTVLWLRAISNATLSITGAYKDPADQIVPAGPCFLPSAGLEPWSPDISRFPDASCWTFGPVASSWHTSLSPSLIPADNDSLIIPPGNSTFIRADTDNLLPRPAAELRLRYYHQDHLGSSTVLADSEGRLAEETANYPFGQARRAFRPRGLDENYQFTQKEIDAESGLQYFETRFLNSSVGRFSQADPLVVSLTKEMLSDPQTLASYAYCNNRPLVLIDPTGMQGTETETAQQARVRTLRKAIANAQETYGKQPKGNTKCNEGIQSVQRELKQPVVPGNANDMYDYYLKHSAGSEPTYRLVTGQQAQALANAGFLVVGVQRNNVGPKGHVSPVAPGELSATDRQRFHNNNPMIGNIGSDEPETKYCPAKTGDQKASCAFANDKDYSDVSYYISTTAYQQYQSEIKSGQNSSSVPNP